MHDTPIARAFALAGLLIAPAALAVTPADIARGYAEEAKQAAPQFGGLPWQFAQLHSLPCFAPKN